MSSFQCGNPGFRSSTLTRGSANNSRATSYLVISHGVLPSQIRTRESGFVAASSITAGGGANGQADERAIGYSGMTVSVWSVP